jgi:hypothetical protein
MSEAMIIKKIGGFYGSQEQPPVYISNRKKSRVFKTTV